MHVVLFEAAIRQTRGHEMANNIFIRISAIYGGGGRLLVGKE